jgi:hypothetical protein
MTMLKVFWLQTLFQFFGEKAWLVPEMGAYDYQSVI